MAHRLYKADVFYPAYQEANTDTTAVTYGIMRLSDGFMYDFGDSTFKNSGWTTQYQTMTEDENGLWHHTTGWTTPNVKATYRIQFKVTDDIGVTYVGGETLEVTDVTPLVIPTTPTPTTVAEMLVAVNAAIAARMTGGAVASYTIGGRSLQYVTLRELMDLRSQLQAESASAQSGARTFASFVSPS